MAPGQRPALGPGPAPEPARERLRDRLEPDEPAVRAQPEEPGPVLDDAEHVVAGEVAVVRGVAREPRRRVVRVERVEAAARPDVERAVVAGVEGADGAVRQRGRPLARREAGERPRRRPVQAAEPAGRPRPDRPVGRRQGPDLRACEGARPSRLALEKLDLPARAVIEPEAPAERPDPEPAGLVFDQARHVEGAAVLEARRQLGALGRDAVEPAAPGPGPDGAVAVLVERLDGDPALGSRDADRRVRKPPAVLAPAQRQVRSYVERPVARLEDGADVVAGQALHVVRVVAEADGRPARPVEAVEPAVGRHPEDALAVLHEVRDLVVAERARVVGDGDVDGGALARREPAEPAAERAHPDGPLRVGVERRDELGLDARA